MSTLKNIKNFAEKHGGAFILFLLLGSPIFIFLLLHLLFWLEPKKLYKIQGEIMQVKRIETVTYWTYDINHNWSDEEKHFSPAIVTERKEAPFENHYKIDPILPPGDKKDYGILLSLLEDINYAGNNWINNWNSWDRKKLPLSERNRYLFLIKGWPLVDSKNYIGCRVNIFYLKGWITRSVYKPVVDISMCKEPLILPNRNPME